MRFKAKARGLVERVRHHYQPSKPLEVATNGDGSVYTALDPCCRSIRVLEIKAGSGTDVVEGTLHIRSLPTTAVTVCRQGLQQLRSGAKDDPQKCFVLLAAAAQAIYHFNEEFIRKSEERTAEDLDFVYEGPNMCILVETVDEMATLVHESLEQANAHGPDEDSAKFAAMLQDTMRTLEAYISQFRDTASSLRRVFERPERLSGIAQIEYEAISYCWGEPRGTAPMLLNGQPFEAPISAVEVLQRFRYRNESRIVWIDAICIRQDDKQEKQLQIPMMADIYRTVTRTLA